MYECESDGVNLKKIHSEGFLWAWIYNFIIKIKNTDLDKQHYISHIYDSELISMNSQRGHHRKKKKRLQKRYKILTTKQNNTNYWISPFPFSFPFPLAIFSSIKQPTDKKKKGGGTGRGRASLILRPLEDDRQTRNKHTQIFHE